MDTIEEIKKAFIRSGMTYDELSAAAGIPVQTIKNITSGRTADPRLQTVRQLQDALSAYLIKDESQNSKNDTKNPEADRYVASLERRVRYQSRWIVILASILFFVLLVLLICVIMKGRIK